MKERQQSPQKAQDHWQEKQEKRGAEQKQSVQQFPVQQLAQLLQQGDILSELPVPLLQELAQIVENSRMIELMRGDSGGVAIACAPQEPEGEADLPPNPIRTSPPKLTVLPEWDSAEGHRPIPVRPRTIRDRGCRPKDRYAEISNRGSG